MCGKLRRSSGDADNSSKSFAAAALDNVTAPFTSLTMVASGSCSIRSETNCRISLAWEIAERSISIADAMPTGFDAAERRSEEHTSELQSLMRISYAVFCLKKKKKQNIECKIYHHTYHSNT